MKIKPGDEKTKLKAERNELKLRLEKAELSMKKLIEKTRRLEKEISDLRYINKQQASDFRLKRRQFNNTELELRNGYNEVIQVLKREKKAHPSWPARKHISAAMKIIGKHIDDFVFDTLIYFQNKSKKNVDNKKNNKVK